MSVQCERQPMCEKQQQEYEFIMEGISTRMTMALEKMADSNRMMSETNKRLVRLIISVLVIVVLGFIVNNMLWMQRDRFNKNTTTSEVVTDAGADSAQRLSELGSQTSY